MSPIIERVESGEEREYVIKGEIIGRGVSDVHIYPDNRLPLLRREGALERAAHQIGITVDELQRRLDDGQAFTF